jgi:hypothetical protein
MSDTHAAPRTTLRKRTRRSFGKIKKLPSGRYQASYLGPDGERHNGPVTFLAKQHADQWLAMRQAEIVEQSWKPPAPAEQMETPTLADYSAAWLLTRRTGTASR